MIAVARAAPVTHLDPGRLPAALPCTAIAERALSGSTSVQRVGALPRLSCSRADTLELFDQANVDPRGLSTSAVVSRHVCTVAAFSIHGPTLLWQVHPNYPDSCKVGVALPVVVQQHLASKP